MRQVKTIQAFVLGCATLCAVSCLNETQKSATLDAVSANEAIQQNWASRRQAAQERATAQARALVRARDALKGKRLGIPRDAAVCFEARSMMQAELEAAMRSGGEFGSALDAWHEQAPAVETFCTYALTVGAPK